MHQALGSFAGIWDCTSDHWGFARSVLVVAHCAWLRNEDVQLVVSHTWMRMPRDEAHGLRMFYLWLRDEDSWLTAQVEKLLLPCMGVSTVDVSHQPSIPKDVRRGRGVVGPWQLLGSSHVITHLGSTQRVVALVLAAGAGQSPETAESQHLAHLEKLCPHQTGTSAGACESSQGSTSTTARLQRLNGSCWAGTVALLSPLRGISGQWCMVLHGQSSLVQVVEHPTVMLKPKPFCLLNIGKAGAHCATIPVEAGVPFSWGSCCRDWSFQSDPGTDICPHSAGFCNPGLCSAAAKTSGAGPGQMGERAGGFKPPILLHYTPCSRFLLCLV